jgi:hypothetical protein
VCLECSQIRKVRLNVLDRHRGPIQSLCTVKDRSPRLALTNISFVVSGRLVATPTLRTETGGSVVGWQRSLILRPGITKKKARVRRRSACEWLLEKEWVAE